MVDDSFGNWLAGFLDGEGCFVIEKSPQSVKQRTYGYFCACQVGLRRDDESILREIAARTGLGTIRHFHPGRGNAAVSWCVRAKVECAEFVKLLDRYPLRAKKAPEYAVWRQAVLAWQSIRKGRNVPRDYSQMEHCAEALKALRAYEGGHLGRVGRSPRDPRSEPPGVMKMREQMEAKARAAA
jgi:hypothetical protein